jgi:pimeloyl-ACP methyl ester carboxylesterase/DNA-binding CsgD family transcriptional regulator
VRVERQRVRNATVDGRSVAWASSGHGPPVVASGWWASHIGLDWSDPLFRRFAQTLAAHRTVVRYDRPGVGLSDPGPPPTTLDAEVAVLAAVVALLPTPVSLLGASSGAPVAIRYAARHPEHVERLVLYGAYASGREIASPAAQQTVLDVVDRHWGLGSRLLADLFLPGGTAEEREAFSRFQRGAASRDVAHESLRAVYAHDASADLAHVRCPTLVLHRRGDRAIPFALGRDLAARIPGAVLVALDGIDHFPWRGDAHAVAAAVLEFLGAPAPSAHDAPDRVRLGQLSGREQEVLALVARGATDRQIAAALVVSPHTVHRHVANIRDKLGVPSRAAAAAWAAEHGLTRGDPRAS